MSSIEFILNWTGSPCSGRRIIYHLKMLFFKGNKTERSSPICRKFWLDKIMNIWILKIEKVNYPKIFNVFVKSVTKWQRFLWKYLKWIYSKSPEFFSFDFFICPSEKSIFYDSLPCTCALERKEFFFVRSTKIHIFPQNDIIYK